MNCLKFAGTRISEIPSSDSYTRCGCLIGDHQRITSTRRSPRSISETKLWVLPNLSAAWIWVSFARRRAAAKHAPTTRYCSGSIHIGKCSPPNLSYRRLGSQSAPRLISMATSDMLPSALRDAGGDRLAPSTVLTLCCFSAASLNAVLSCGADRAAQTPRRYGFEVGSAVSVGVLTTAE